MVKRKTSEGFAKTTINVLKYVIIIIVVYYCAMASYHFGKEIFSNEGVEMAPGTAMTIEIGDNTSMRQLAKTLEEYGIIKDDKVFIIQSYIYSVKSVKAGTYTFNTSDSGEDILKIVSVGPDGTREEETTEN